jgi:hypothetical protein
MNNIRKPRELAVSLQVIGLASAYSTMLSLVERKYPGVKPDHIWAEVVGGVLITLLPVAIAARQDQHAPTEQPMTWQTYEGMVWQSFFAAGMPIVLWQITEALSRHVELLSYTTQRHLPRSSRTSQLIAMSELQKGWDA